MPPSPRTRLSYPRRRVSSTLRPFGAITAASGILDHPPSRVMTTETHLRIPAAHSARALQIVSPNEKRAQGMPGACCTRGLLCNSAREVRTRAYRYSRSIPASPAQWFYGLCRALPGDEFLLPPSSANLRRSRARSGSQHLRRLDASHGRQDHTVLPYASASFVCRATDRSRAKARPSISLAQPALPRPPHSEPNVRDDRDTPLLAGRNAAGCSADLGVERRGLFLLRWLDRANHVDWVEENRRARTRRTVEPASSIAVILWS